MIDRNLDFLTAPDVNHVRASGGDPDREMLLPEKIVELLDEVLGVGELEILSVDGDLESSD